MRRRSRETAASGEERPPQRLIILWLYLEQWRFAALSKGQRRSCTGSTASA